MAVMAVSAVSFAMNNYETSFARLLLPVRISRGPLTFKSHLMADEAEGPGKHLFGLTVSDVWGSADTASEFAGLSDHSRRRRKKTRKGTCM